MSVTPQVYAKVKGEIVALFGWNADSLSPEQTLRIDCAVAMRIGLDDLQGRVMRGDGESVDMAKMLTISEALARILPPSALASPPAEQREDRDAAVAPLLKLFRHLHESVHTLSAENAQLRAALGGSQSPFDRQMTRQRDISSAITPPTCDIVPPSERAECDAGPRPGPDDPAPRSTTVIEGKAVKPAPAAPAPRATPTAKPAWQDWLDAGGYGGPGFDRWSNRNF
jgi:hypothetical protein